MIKTVLLAGFLMLLSLNNIKAQYYSENFQTGEVPKEWNNHNGLLVSQINNNKYLLFSAIAPNTSYSITSPLLEIKPNTKLKIKLASSHSTLKGEFKVSVQEEGQHQYVETAKYQNTDIIASGTKFKELPVPEDYSKEIDLSKWAGKKIKLQFEAFISSGRGTSFYLDEIELIEDKNLSTNEIGKQNIFQIYPNPTSDFINIGKEFAIERIEIYTLDGSLIHTGNRNNISVRHLLSGTYLLKAIDKKNGVKTSKFVKK